MPELAGYGSRAAAWIMDVVASWVFAAVVGAPWILADALIADDTVDLIVGLPFFIAAVVVFLLYEPLLMRRRGAHNGQTLGKQATGIRVVRDDGQPVTFSTGFLRDFVFKFLLGFFTSGLYSLVDYLWPLFDEERRALHDIVASTHVVRA